VKLLKSEVLGIRNLRALGFETSSGDVLSGVSTDSRTTKPGDAFFAIRGEKYDGHDFITKAIGGGAAVVIVDRKWADANGTMLVSIGVPRLVVENTTTALGDLASRYRAQFNIPTIAIAGSNGKTTTKNMVSAVLGTKYNVLSTEGNLNNQIGVPQTLFRLTADHDVAVVEIGTNHFGEIASLCQILAPTHGVITNIGREHLEYFGSLDGVAKAEGELLDWLRSNKGAFFLNKDDERLSKRTKRLKGLKTISFGFRAGGTHCKGSLLGSNETGCARLGIRPKGKKPFEYQLNVPGEQNAKNALAASAIGLAMKVSTKNVIKALTGFTAAGKRSEIIRLNGVTILNDSYNANPDSVVAALKTLRSMRTTGRRIAVLGDMLELGKSAEKEHRRIGRAAAQFRVDCLFTYGNLSKSTHEAAKVKVKTHFEDKTMLAEQLADFVSGNDAVLVKGSRGMKMEEVVAHLQQKLKE
jgi:UDP-N-acetylmuramoyl-tripeptide--D-alanyl-D-alanine ligase